MQKLSLISYTLLGLLVMLQAQAQVVTDGSLGTATNLTGPNFAITEDLGQTVGNNLFHSFETFNVFRNESATFSGANNIENIISRVTGGNASFINGVLRSTIPEADLYLVNPAGILFGAEASLDIQGSFHASTADYLKLGEEGRFDASQIDNTILSVEPVSAFGFLGDPVGNLTVNGSTLQVPGGEALSMIGGDLEIKNGSLVAPSGRIDVVAVASKGEVTTSNSGLNLESFSSLGKIAIEGDNLTEANAEIKVSAFDANSHISGEIEIQADEVTLKNSSIIGMSDVQNGSGNIIITANSLRLISQTDVINTSGDIAITTKSLEMLPVSSTQSPNNISSISGNIMITSNLLTMGGGGNIKNVLGNITIIADSLLLDFLENDSSLGVISQVQSSFTRGNSIKTELGNIIITTNALNGGNISSISGDTIISTNLLNNSNVSSGSGNIKITTTTNSLMLDRVEILHDSGIIEIIANSLILNDMNFFESSTNDDELSGTILIKANFLDMNNSHIENPLLGNAEILVNTINMENSSISSGDIIVQSDALKMNHSIISSGVSKQGKESLAGNITIISAKQILLDSSRINSDSVSIIDAGDIKITTPLLSMFNNSFIFAKTFGEGAAGNIEINTTEMISLREGSQLSANSEVKASNKVSAIGNAGNITINSPLLEINGENSFISSTTLSDGNAGNININVGQLKLLEQGSIISRTGTIVGNFFNLRDGGLGQGGNIIINASESILITGSNVFKDLGITASSFSPAVSLNKELKPHAGNITINTPNLTLDNQGAISSITFSSGNAGIIILNVDNLLLDHGSKITASNAPVSQGSAGKVVINATQNIILQNLSGIKSTTRTNNIAGSVSLNATNISLLTGSSISSDSQPRLNGDTDVGDAGTINIESKHLTINGCGIQSPNQCSKITSNSKTFGNAGDINIVVNDLNISQQGIISSTTTDNGKGGNITITAKNINIFDKNSKIRHPSFPS